MNGSIACRTGRIRGAYHERRRDSLNHHHREKTPGKLLYSGDRLGRAFPTALTRLLVLIWAKFGWIWITTPTRLGLVPIPKSAPSSATHDLRPLQQKSEITPGEPLQPDDHNRKASTPRIQQAELMETLATLVSPSCRCD